MSETRGTGNASPADRSRGIGSPLIVSAPFGNYVQPEGATATLGTFTAARRPGRLFQIIRTVRYYRRLRAWVNKIGLRNPGIDWLVERVRAGSIDVSDKLVSIHGFSEDDWRALIEKAGAIEPLAIELNMSCPNVGEIDWPEWLFVEARASGVPVVVKIPPVRFELLVEQAIAADCRTFHCCNTLPVPAGGLSGSPLKPVALECIREMRARPDGDELTIIGGGGIREPGDIDEYSEAGADAFAIATKVFHPKYLFSHSGLTPILERARERARIGTPDGSGSGVSAAGGTSRS